MEQDKNYKQLKQTKMWVMVAAFISLLAFAATLYYGRKLYMKMPKPMAVPTLAMHEMTFTEKMQEDMFARKAMVEVKFEWVASTRNDTTELTLTAIGGYMEGGRFVWDEGSRVPLAAGNRKYYADATRNNYDSPIYYSLEDMKILHRVDGEGPLDPQDIGAAILMTPYTSSDAARRYCVYYGGSTSNESRIANPAPPFSSLSEAAAD